MRQPHAHRPLRLVLTLLLTQLAYATLQSQTYLICKQPSSQNCLKWKINLDQVTNISNIAANKIAIYCGLSDLHTIASHRKFIQIKKINVIPTSLENIYCERIMEMYNWNPYEWKEIIYAIRNSIRVRRQSLNPRGRFRGQTQSQYLTIDRGTGKDEGKAEAHSAADSSRASVSGNSGMGQAQSQSIYDTNCDDCIGRSSHEVENLRRPKVDSTWPGKDVIGPSHSHNGGFSPTDSYLSSKGPNYYGPGSGVNENSLYGPHGAGVGASNTGDDRYRPNGVTSDNYGPGIDIDNKPINSRGVHYGPKSNGYIPPGTTGRDDDHPNLNGLKLSDNNGGYFPGDSTRGSLRPGTNVGYNTPNTRNPAPFGPGRHLDGTDFNINRPQEGVEFNGEQSTSKINPIYSPETLTSGIPYSPDSGSSGKSPVGFGTQTGLSNWPLIPYTRPDGSSVYCCVVPNTGKTFSPYGTYETPSNSISPGNARHYNTGIGPDSPRRQFIPEGITGFGPRGQYGPGDTSGPVGKYGPKGTAGVGEQYIPGGITVSGGQYNPGGMIAQGDKYGPTGNIGAGGQYVPGGTYGPGVQTGQGGMTGPVGQYEPGGLTGPRDQYGLGGTPNLVGHFGPGGITGTGEQYGPSGTTGQGGFIGQTGTPGGQYRPGGTTGPGDHYGPGGPGGQYGPGEITGSGGQYGPGGTTGQGGFIGQTGTPGGQYGPGGTTGPGDDYGPGGTTRPGGQYGPGGITGSGGQYGPGGTNGQGGFIGQTGIPGGQYGPGGTTGSGGQYGPGGTTGQGGSIGQMGTPGGQYGPGGTTGQGEPIGQGGNVGPGGQYGPGRTTGQGGSIGQTGTPGGQYGPGGTTGPGDHYGPGGTTRPGGQYGPGGITGSGGQYGPGGTTGQGGSIGQMGTPGGQYGPGGTTGQGGPIGQGGNVGPGGQYGPGRTTGQGGSIGQAGTPGGQYGPGGTTGQGGPIGQGGIVGPGGQYGPGGTTGHGGPIGQNDFALPGGQYGPGQGPIGQAATPGGQYGSGGTTGHGGPIGQNGFVLPGGQYGPGGTGQGGPIGQVATPGGQYGPGGETGHGGPIGQNGFALPGGQYGPGGTGHGRPIGQAATPGGQYGPGGTTGQGGPIIGQGGTVGPGGQQGSGGNIGVGPLYRPGGTSGPGGQIGQGGMTGPGSQYGPGGAMEPGGHYGPGGTNGPVGQYGPGGITGPASQFGPGGSTELRGQYGPGRTSGMGGPINQGGSASEPGVQFGSGRTPGQGNIVGPGGQYGSGGQDGMTIPGGQYGPDGTTGPGGQIGQGGMIGPGGQYVPSGTNELGQYGPGTQSRPGPGTIAPDGRSPYGYHNMTGPGEQTNEYTGVPQNYVDPNSIIADGDDSKAEASVAQNINGTIASAASKGGNDKGHAQTSVQGTYTGSGSFQAQAQITGENKEAQSEVSGGKKGASSSASGSGRNNKSQANVQLGSETGSIQTQSQSNGVMHSSQSQVHGGVKGGMADAQARGPGSTSSQAQIGFTPYTDEEKSSHDLLKVPYAGGGMASAQSSGRTGQSQSQLHGTFKYGITYNGAAQSGASLDKEAVFANRLSFEKIDVFDEKDKYINVDNITSYTTETPQAFNTEQGPMETSTILDLDTLLTQQITEIPTTENIIDESMKNSESRYSGHPHSNHHNSESFNSTDQYGSTLSGSRRSFQTNYANPPEYEFTTDKDDNQPEYDTEVGYDGDGNEANDVEQTEYSNYDEYTRDPVTHQYLQNPSRKGIDIQQTTGGNTQHIVLGSLKNHNAEIIQKDSEIPDENKMYQPGERIPGMGGYIIPAGFTGSVKSVASRDKTYVIGSKDSPSQAQTVTLTPGTGKVRYPHPYKNYVKPKNLRSLKNPEDNDNRYVSVSKSVTRALDSDNNIRKQYSHTYYTKSSSCGYFTFSCTMVGSPEGRKKVCRPKMPTNPDGTPIGC